MSPKFKVGDKVVRISFEVDYRYIPSQMYGEGEAFVISDITFYPDENVYWGPNHHKDGCFEHELELESVYNSKLYNSLK